jgi:hypothetical protein
MKTGSGFPTGLRRLKVFEFIKAPALSKPVASLRATTSSGDSHGRARKEYFRKGMPWPIDELLKRDRAIVMDTAWQCLSQSGTALHSHAFCVRLLVSLRPSDLDRRLLALYPDLDALVS